jgi:glutaminyl-peptide cyclotransferase
MRLSATTFSLRVTARVFAHALATFLALAASACAARSPMPNAPPTLSWRIVRELPHDVAHFTQGLEIVDGRLLESVGQFGRSALLIKDLGSGQVLAGRALPREEFGEGASVFGDRVVQLTWRNGRAHVYDLSLRELAGFAYGGEGWGLAHDERALIMSDGSARLQFRDPASFALTRSLDVQAQGVPVASLNELEYARGRIYANVWKSDRIAVIDPASGAVTAWVDLAALSGRFTRPDGWNAADHVLNGIAFEPRSGHFLVTGKCWPTLFEIAVDPPP